MIDTPEFLKVGEKVKNSPVGCGRVTGITPAGYPKVNGTSVGWLILERGEIFDPRGRLDGDGKLI